MIDDNLHRFSTEFLERMEAEGKDDKAVRRMLEDTLRQLRYKDRDRYNDILLALARILGVFNPKK